MIYTTFSHPVPAADRVFIDIETFGPTGEISVVRDLKPVFIKGPKYHGGLSLGLGSISLVTVLLDDNDAPTIYEYRQMEDAERAQLLTWVFNPSHTLIAHNAGFDLSFLLREVLRLEVPLNGRPKVMDTLHMAKIAQTLEMRRWNSTGGKPGRLGLRDCCQRYLDLDIDKTQQTADWAGEITVEMVEYAEIDVLALRALLESPMNCLCDGYREVIEQEGRSALEVALVAARGMHIALDDLIGMTEELSQRLIDQRDEMTATTGMTTITGPGFAKFLADQDIELLKDETGRTMCSKLSLNLARDEHPAIGKYLAYLDTKQELDKVLSLWAGYDSDVERVFALWTSWSAPSGRLGSSKPNLMSLPKTVRRIVTPPSDDGHLSVADLSQIQVRAVATVSGCEQLGQQFLDGGDVHRQLASQVYEKPASEVTSVERSAVKPGTFGFLFGGGVETFVKSQIERGNLIGWEDAERIKSAFSKAFPGVVTWQRRGFRQIKETHAGGRLDHTVGGLPYWVMTGTANLNYPIQAYDALVLKLFLEEAHSRRWKVVGLLHDEVVVEDVPISEVIALLEHVGTAVLDFPVEAEGAEQSSWAA